jgi:hypothetical protein
VWIYIPVRTAYRNITNFDSSTFHFSPVTILGARWYKQIFCIIWSIFSQISDLMFVYNLHLKRTKFEFTTRTIYSSPSETDFLLIAKPLKVTLPLRALWNIHILWSYLAIQSVTLIIHKFQRKHRKVNLNSTHSRESEGYCEFLLLPKKTDETQCVISQKTELFKIDWIWATSYFTAANFHVT